MDSKELFYPNYELEIKLNSGSKREVNETHAVGFDFEPSDWRFPYIDYVIYGILPEDPKESVSILTLKFGHYIEKSFNGILLRCLSKKEV